MRVESLGRQSIVVSLLPEMEMQQRATIFACTASKFEVAPPRFDRHNLCWQDACELRSTLQEPDNLVKRKNVMPSVGRHEGQIIAARELQSVLVSL
jgi:hypothetical protein